MEQLDTRLTASPRRRLSRRHLIAAGLGAPILAALGAVVRAGEGALRAAAPAARPEPRGTSADRCARCGAPDHTMLGGCPLDPLPRAPRLRSAGSAVRSKGRG